MDEVNHQYKVNVYVNLTSSHATALYPQFLIQSILKGAFEDDDFEFNLRLTPMPITKEVADKGDILDAKSIE